MNGKRLDVHGLYSAVTRRGGFRAAPEASRRLRWGEIFAEMGNYLGPHGPAPPARWLVGAYQELLAEYEAEHMEDLERARLILVGEGGEGMPDPGRRVQIFWRSELNWLVGTVGECEGPSLVWVYYDGSEPKLENLSACFVREHPRVEEAAAPHEPAGEHLASRRGRLPEATEAAETLLGARWSSGGCWFPGWRGAAVAAEEGAPWLADRLREHEVDQESLPLLTEEDLIDLGVLPRRLRLRLLARFRGSSTPPR